MKGDAGMKYKINSRKATEAEAREAIRAAVPNGGVEFLENAIRNGRREELESVTIHIGQKQNVKIIFR